MIIRLGYVAMSVHLQNASPSKTMTYKRFQQIENREAAVHKLERIAQENLHNSLRLLRHNRAHDIHVYRFSSKLIPLYGHEQLADWSPIDNLQASFKEIGDYVKQHQMRVSFHPNHFTVLSTPRAEVYEHSVQDLERHVRMLDAMGLDEQAKCNIHIGGIYGNREQAYERFLEQFGAMKTNIQKRITLENDDKTFTATETLAACEALHVPMVLDVHHDAVNHEDHREPMAELWPRILHTWTAADPSDSLPTKIHLSSPKSERDPRGHADYVNLSEWMPFLRSIAPVTPRLDIMIEAKKKDEALFQLMRDFLQEEGVRERDPSTIELE